VTDVGSPLDGEVVGLAGVPDPVFAEAMVGPGTAIDPGREPAQAVAPVSGKLIKLHPHAFVLVDQAGHGVLVHLGIDTVQMKGEGFTLLAAEGDEVHAGQPLVRWDPSAVEASGRSPVSPVIALDAPAEALTDLVDPGPVRAGDRLFSWQ
jgi:PTS system glucose-specific IIA component